MKFGVVRFPGSNCDDDAHYAIGSVIGQPVEFIGTNLKMFPALTRSFFPAVLPSAITCAPARLRDFLQ